MTETDAPFLPPQCLRWQQNEPAYVSYVYEKLWEILWKNNSEISDLILSNTKELYSI